VPGNCGKRLHDSDGIHAAPIPIVFNSDIVNRLLG